MKRIIAIILSLLIFFSSILVNVIVKDVCSVAKEQMNVVDVQMDGHGSAALLSNGELYFGVNIIQTRVMRIIDIFRKK